MKTTRFRSTAAISWEKDGSAVDECGGSETNDLEMLLIGVVWCLPRQDTVFTSSEVN